MPASPTAGRPAAATAFAPATVANVGVGFDVLGFAFDGPGDRVTVVRDETTSAITIAGVSGVVPDLPTDPQRNTASVALGSLVERCRPGHGFRLSIEKGIPLGSGMGGSAASAVAAVVAANALLDRPVERDDLLEHCLAGERAASGHPHADNAAPCLYGGLTAVVADQPCEVVPVPLAAEVSCVLVHPHLEIRTREARDALPRRIGLDAHVRQSMRLAGFLIGAARGDTGLIRRSMVDLIVGPARAGLIPGFDHARDRALAAGALGLAIAGSGPSVFAWVETADVGRRVAAEVVQVFADRGIAADHWIGPIRAEGAAVVDAG